MLQTSSIVLPGNGSKSYGAPAVRIVNVLSAPSQQIFAQQYADVGRIGLCGSGIYACDVYEYVCIIEIAL